jgi:hypothetical protein
MLIPLSGRMERIYNYKRLNPIKPKTLPLRSTKLVEEKHVLYVYF